MKKHIILFVIIIVGMLMGIFQLIRLFVYTDHSADLNSSISSVGNITFDSLTVDTLAQLSELQPDAQVHIHLSIMYAKGNDNINRAIAGCGIFFPENINTDSLSLLEVANQFMRQYVDDFRNDYKDIYSVEQGATKMDISYIVSTKIEAIADRTFAYVATTFQDNGGPFPSKVIYAKNIDVKTGRPLELDDIFVGGYHHKLTDKIVNQMCRNFKVDDFAALQQKEIFAGIDAYPSKNFVVSKDTLTFIYNSDEIAPHDQGEIRVKIPKSDLAGILR